MANTAKLSQIVALPLLSAVNAQHESSMKVLEILRSYGVGEGQLQNLKFKTKKQVNDEEVDVEINTPLVGLINMPSMQIQELVSEFYVKLDPKNAGAKDPLAEVVSPQEKKGSLIKMTIKINKDIPEGLARLSDILTDQTSAKINK